MPATARQSPTFIAVSGEVILAGSARYDKVLEVLTEWTDGITEEKIARFKLGVTSDAEWDALISDRDVIAAIMDLQHERKLSGASTQALARTFYAKGPKLLDGIANDSTQPARARIDALRELRMQAGFGTDEDGWQGGQKFSLVINIGDGAPRVINVTPGPHNLQSTSEADARNLTPGVSRNGAAVDASPRPRFGPFLDEPGEELEDVPEWKTQSMIDFIKWADEPT
jgi:hypothetical protein